MSARSIVVVASAALWGLGCRTGAGAERRGDFVDEGPASFYGKGLDGRQTASGERFNKSDFTAAHRSLRFGTCLVVENLRNQRRVEVRVNDRGPFVLDRIIDVSEAAARELDLLTSGVARVRLYRCGQLVPRVDAPAS